LKLEESVIYNPNDSQIRQHLSLRNTMTGCIVNRSDIGYESQYNDWLYCWLQKEANNPM